MELYVIRHGTTEWNKKHKLQGASDIPLDEDGRALAQETAEGMKGIHFDRCYTSPLSRAAETARIILGDSGTPVFEDERLKEFCFGTLEGHGCKESDPDYDPLMGQIMKFEMDSEIAAEGGETLKQVLARTASFAEELLEDPALENERILLSMHGVSGRALMHYFWGGDDFWRGNVPRNCTVCIVRLDHGQVREIEKDVVFYRSEGCDYYD